MSKEEAELESDLESAKRIFRHQQTRSQEGILFSERDILRLLQASRRALAKAEEEEEGATNELL